VTGLANALQLSPLPVVSRIPDRSANRKVASGVRGQRGHRRRSKAKRGPGAPDSRDGILIGTSLGFLIPALISRAIDTGEPGEAAAFLIRPGLGIGMAVGWIVDALRHTKIQIFPATPSRVAVVPMLGRGRKGVAASLRF
jgi:hypothetical protein